MSDFRRKAEHLSNVLLEGSFAFVPSEVAPEPIIADVIFALVGWPGNGTVHYDKQSEEHSRR